MQLLRRCIQVKHARIGKNKNKNKTTTTSYQCKTVVYQRSQFANLDGCIVFLLCEMNVFLRRLHANVHCAVIVRMFKSTRIPVHLPRREPGGHRSGRPRLVDEMAALVVPTRHEHMRCESCILSHVIGPENNSPCFVNAYPGAVPVLRLASTGLRTSSLQGFCGGHHSKEPH